MIQRDIILTVLLFLCICVFAVLYYIGQYCKKEKYIRVLGVFSAWVSVFFFAYLAVFRRPSGDETLTALAPLLSYRQYITWYGGIDVFAQDIENIMIFVPIGFSLPFVLGEKCSSFVSVGSLGFLLSLFAEVSQLIFKLGVCETDDVLNNTIGAVVGFGIYYSMTACRAQKGRKPVYQIEKPKRFLLGLLPLFAVYQLLVLIQVLRAVWCLV
ncbi:MAG: VanZ family protein [Acutalibacteraceae bacterium]